MQMATRKLFWVGILTALLLGGCASGGKDAMRPASDKFPEELRSGFLQDYDRIQPVKGEPAVMRWINPEVDWARYKRFMIEPVDSVVPRAYRKSLQPDPDVVSTVTKYFRNTLVREFGAKYEVVDDPGEGVARVSVAITSIQPTSKQLSGWQYLPIGLIAAGVSEVAGTREKDVVVFMEGEMTDSLNGELLMEVMQGRVSTERGNRRIDDITPETVKPILNFWAQEHVKVVEQAKSGKR